MTNTQNPNAQVIELIHYKISPSRVKLTLPLYMETAVFVDTLAPMLANGWIIAGNHSVALPEEGAA